MILSQAQINAAIAVDSTITYWVYEDDNTACLLLLASANEPNDVKTALQAYTPGQLVGWRNKPPPYWLDPIQIAVGFARTIVAALFSSSKDDIVGMAVSPVPYGLSFTDANVVVLNRDGILEGRLKLVKY